MFVRTANLRACAIEVNSIGYEKSVVEKRRRDELSRLPEWKRVEGIDK